MKTLNDEFDEFRDCLRLTWNYALRKRATGENAYAAVSAALLQALVLDGLERPPAAESARDEDGALPDLGLTIASAAPEILLPRETETEIIWERVDPAAVTQDALFLYADLFDFREFDEMHYYDYVKAIAAVDAGAIPKGATVAVRRSDVDVVDLTARRR